ncbi:hypothetical protein [Microtetraspora malaysiensis]|uniref:hypothetical protein n=1 Tax=Microtetraspora malaysiensis TaxID=161358 RepID=UPI003D8D9E37
MTFVGERQLRATKAPPEKFTGGNVWETSALEELRPDGLRALRFSRHHAYPCGALARSAEGHVGDRRALRRP